MHPLGLIEERGPFLDRASLTRGEHGCAIDLERDLAAVRALDELRADAARQQSPRGVNVARVDDEEPVEFAIESPPYLWTTMLPPEINCVFACVMSSEDARLLS